MSTQTKGILFVCLGNICRSPAAEGVALHLANLRAEHAPDRETRTVLDIDSAGTSGFHDGEPPDARMMIAANERGYSLPSLSRRVRPADFSRFGWIVAMDRDNFRNLEAEKPPQSTANICLFSDFAGAPWPTDVPDPYFGGEDGFTEVLGMLEAGMPSLLDSVFATND